MLADRGSPTSSTPKPLAGKVTAAVDAANSPAAYIESFARRLVTGEPENMVGLGTALGDLFVFGDIRDMVREGHPLCQRSAHGADHQARREEGQQDGRLPRRDPAVARDVQSCSLNSRRDPHPVRTVASAKSGVERQARTGDDAAATLGFDHRGYNNRTSLSSDVWQSTAPAPTFPAGGIWFSGCLKAEAIFGLRRIYSLNEGLVSKSMETIGCASAPWATLRATPCTARFGPRQAAAGRTGCAGRAGPEVINVATT